MRGMKSFREGVDNNNMDLVILPMGILVMSLGYTKLHMKRESKKEMKSKLKSWETDYKRGLEKIEFWDMHENPLLLSQK